MAEPGDKMSPLWRAGIEADIARAWTIPPEELLAEVRAAERRKAEMLAAVKAGRATMRAGNGPAAAPGASKSGEASVVGVGGTSGGGRGER
jgi:hypothetical protein